MLVLKPHCAELSLVWFGCMQEWADNEAGKLRILAQHVIRITQRTPHARCRGMISNTDFAVLLVC